MGAVRWHSLPPRSLAGSAGVAVATATAAVAAAAVAAAAAVGVAIAVTGASSQYSRVDGSHPWDARMMNSDGR